MAQLLLSVMGAFAEFERPLFTSASERASLWRRVGACTGAVSVMPRSCDRRPRVRRLNRPTKVGGYR